MKILIILCLFLISCKQDVKENTKEPISIIDEIVNDEPKQIETNPEQNTEEDEITYIEIGKKTLIELEFGTYVYAGSAHPTLYGNVIDIFNGVYKLAIWENGNVKIEEGNYSFKEIIDIDEENLIKTYSYKIIYNPTRYNPTNCGDSLSSYEENYFWKENLPDLTKFFSNIDTSNYAANGYTKTVDWPEVVTPDYVENNLNPTCL